MQLERLLQKAQEASTESADAVPAESVDSMSSETAGKGSRRKLSPAREHSTPGSTELSSPASAPSTSANDANSVKSLGAVETPVGAPSGAESSITHKAIKAPKRKKARPDNQLHLFGDEVSSPAVDPTQLRKAVNQILPLLAERDPGAKDCLRDSRKTFRSAFTPEAYVEFEQLVKNVDFDAALEQLKKAVRKHGISL